jgi:dTDP-4-amino-4,6-dideoxygalactose transaminase
VSATQVPFLDLASQIAPLREEIDAALRRVLDSGWFVLGPELEAFERELAERFGAHTAIGVANGTEALQLALEALGVGPGDEVITTPLTAAFTALAIVRAGARPVFADVDPRTLNLDPTAAERAITLRTRALLPVHLYGHPANLDPLREIARRHGLVLIEDGCQAHGAKYKDRAIGATGAVALSFYPTKNLGALGDGGALLLDDDEAAARVRELRNGGQRARYEHVRLGMNSRLDELQAAVLRVKLRRLESWVERRRALAEIYREELAGCGLDLPEEASYARAAWHLFVVRHPRRDALAAALKVRGVETLVHYPVPVHRQPAFAVVVPPETRFPVAELAASSVLSLPLYPEMSDARVRFVAGVVREAVAAIG